MAEQQKPTLAARLLAVMGEVGYIQKQGKTDSGPKFSYVRHDDVVATLRPALIKHGIAFLASTEEKSIGCEQVGVTKSGAARYKTTLVLTLTFVNVDNPEDQYSVSFPGEGVDTDDKGSGKALSYALKNGLLKMFMIEAGDDADVERGAPEAAPMAAPTADPDAQPLGTEGWAGMVAGAAGLGVSQERLAHEFARYNYADPAAAPLGFAKQVYAAMQQAVADNAATRQTLQDAQREQAAAAAAPQPAPPVAQPAQAPYVPAAGEVISMTQVANLRAMIYAKGYNEAAVTGPLGIASLEVMPASKWDAVVAGIRGLPDPTPQPTQAPPAAEAAPQPPQVAPAPQAAPAAQDGPSEDESVPGMDAAQARVKFGGDHPPWGTVTKPGTINAERMTTLCAQCSQLESRGVASDQWREFMWTSEKVTSRKELSKAAADRCINYLRRWLIDLESGVARPEEGAAA